MKRHLTKAINTDIISRVLPGLCAVGDSLPLFVASFKSTYVPPQTVVIHYPNSYYGDVKMRFSGRLRGLWPWTLNSPYPLSTMLLITIYGRKRHTPDKFPPNKTTVISSPVNYTILYGIPNRIPLTEYRKRQEIIHFMIMSFHKPLILYAWYGSCPM